jgi:hypothetical protein
VRGLVGNMKPKFKLGKAEIQKRVLELETLFGQAKLSKKLGVSKDSIRRYRDGKTLPQTKNIYKKLNAAYNKNKKFIDTGLVEKKRQQITKRKTVQAKGKTKERTTIIYPDYMYNSPAKDFSEARYFEKLEDLHNSGYVASWVGGKETPLEVQFIIDGEDLTRFGKVVNIVGVVTTEVSPKEENGFSNSDAALKVYPTYFRIIPGFKYILEQNKKISFDERMDILRDFFFNLKVERGYTIAFMGFYFDEEDEA